MHEEARIENKESKRLKEENSNLKIELDDLRKRVEILANENAKLKEQKENDIDMIIRIAKRVED